MDTSEFYRKRHPDLFSDSRIIKVSKLDRDFLDYYLATLTSRSQEKNFETFCKMIAEKVICPNLMPQTGPTGGGDSKVDSETYPVSDEIALVWYLGIGREASKEKWAFAFSAKKDWKSKLQSDIAKIAATGRDYVKAFFMSNQYISDKNRSELETSLGHAYGFEVHILDKLWLLDKTFNNKLQKIVVECFGLSESFLDEIQKGPADYAKEVELNELEESIKRLNTSGLYAAMIPPALEIERISRSLERPESETINYFKRAYDIIEKYGTCLQKAECVYDWAWTLYWWHKNFDEYYLKYCEYENIVIENENISFMHHLTTLWFNLYSLCLDNPQMYNLEKHTRLLIEKLQEYKADTNKPHSAFEAEARLIFIRLLLHESIDNLIEELTCIINESDDHVDFDLISYSQMITENALLKKSEQYDTLFEILAEKLSTRKQEVSLARMLIKRARELDEDKPYSAIILLGRALKCLLKEESKEELIMTLYSLGKCYENIGCLWAARNYYLHLLCICIKRYFIDGEIHPAMVATSNHLEMIELQLGRVIYAIEFNELFRITNHIYITANPKNKIPKDELFDPMLAIAILKTDFSKLEYISYLPNMLEKNGLYISYIASKYILGYYDEDFLKNRNNNIESYNEFFKKLYSQPANEQIVYSTWYGFDKEAVIHSKVLGCRVDVAADNRFPCIELASSICAMLESFFSTAIMGKIVVLTTRLFIEIRYSESSKFIIDIKVNEKERPDIVINCSDYIIDEFFKSQEKTYNILFEVLAAAIAKMVHFEISKDTIEKMIKEEDAFGRSIPFINSVFLPPNTLGKDFGMFDKWIRPEGEQFPLKREEPLQFKNEINELDKEEELRVEYQSKKRRPDESVKQQDMHVESVIDMSLWDLAKWRGVSYFCGLENEFPPIISFLFDCFENGNKIFMRWIEEYSRFDEKNIIQIGIIKGIDLKKPSYYRVVITSNVDSVRATIPRPKYIQWINRFHTMEATTLDGLNRFEEALRHSSVYFLSQSMMNLSRNIEINKATMIKKNRGSIYIKNAYEINENDLVLSMGLFPDDNPIIPPGYEDAPVIKMLETIREINKTPKTY